jgi:hypothetical protein
MQRIIVLTAVIAALAAPAHAQFVVIDPGNLAQAVLIADRTLREYETLVAQYETLVRMSQGLGNLDSYRIPPVPNAEHDVSRWEFGGPWLQGLNSGDPDGAAYRGSKRHLEPPASILQQLPPDAQRAIEQAYATVDVTDAVAQAGGQQVALIRNYGRRLQQAIDALEGDVVSADPRSHEMTAVLDKVAAGSLLARRQDMATNQLLSSALEQLLARSKRLRDTDAVTMNMRIGNIRSGRAAGASVVRGAADDLRTWQQP